MGNPRPAWQEQLNAQSQVVSLRQALAHGMPRKSVETARGREIGSGCTAGRTRRSAGNRRAGRCCGRRCCARAATRC